MKVILMGNAGAGKTTLAKELLKLESAAVLSLDQVAFDRGATRRPVAESVTEVLEFCARNASWIVEGCYADIIEPVLPHCETLVFLNPGVETCIEHCRRRPWEAAKFDSPAEQEANLDNLLRWVSEYEHRTDEYGLSRHRRLFESFPGRKIAFERVEADAARRVVAAT